MSLRDLLLALLVVSLWGFNFVVVKVGVGHFPPFLFLTLRFLSVALLVVPFVRLTRQQLPWILLLSFVFGSLHFGPMFAGFANMDAATGAILAQLGVPFSTLLAAFFLKDKLGVWRVGGLTLAFLGAAVLAGEPRLPALGPFFLLVLAGLAWAIANLLVKKVSNMSGLAMTGWISLFAMPQTILWSFVFEEGQWQVLADTTPFDWAVVAYVSIGSSVIAYSLWYHLLSRYPVSSVVPITLLAPVIGVIGSISLLGEPLTWQKLVGGCMTITGVGVILWRQSRRGEAPAAPLEAEPVPGGVIPREDGARRRKQGLSPESAPERDLG